MTPLQHARVPSFSTMSLETLLMPAIDRVESVMDGFGLMTGEYAEYKRMAVGYLLAAVVITWYKPSFAYVNGKARNWLLLDPSDKDATYFPWYVAALGGAFLMGVLI